VEGGVPPELESLILLLLERDPARRPANAAAVADELDRLAAAGGLRWKLDETPRRPASARHSGEATLHAQWVPTTWLGRE
jgi:hypothetical protein